MQISINKTKATSIALVLMLTIAATLITVLSAVNAQTEHYVDSYMFIAPRPNPVGVGQTVMILFWHDKEPPETPEDPSYGTPGGRAAWIGITVTVTKPDGTTQTLGPFKTDPAGSQYTDYVPETVGTYYLQVHFPGQWKNNTTNQPQYQPATYFRPASSEKVALTVQPDPIPAWPAAELPTDYWERPMEAQNREWYTIGGNWLGVPGKIFSGYNSSGSFNPYTTAPNTAHVVWTKPIAFMGVVGGEFGTKTYYQANYEKKWSPYHGHAPVIIGGRLYYNQRLGSSDFDGLACVDLRTGEEIWYRRGTEITMGQLVEVDTPDQHGIIPYLWSFSYTFKMYDAWTGEWILDIENVPIWFHEYAGVSYRVVMSERGELLVYVYDHINSWLAMWNSSKVEGMISTMGMDPETGQYWPGFINQRNRWRPPTGATLDWLTGIEWNVTVTRLGWEVPFWENYAFIAAISDEMIFLSERVGHSTIRLMSFDAKTGQQLWTKNMTSGCAFRPYFFFTEIVDGKFAWWKQETRQWFGFDAYTGKQIWGPTEPPKLNAWGMFLSGWGGRPTTVAYGKIYYGSWDGMLHCLDMETGKYLWNYTTGFSGFETAFNHWPLSGGPPTVADGKVFIWSTDHTPDSPLWRGNRLHCVDAKTGAGIWNISGWYENPIVADGYLVTFNNYDGKIYCFGKGKTATTVTASPKVSVHGTSILIEGTVTDQSPGAEGTPAIADGSMSEWMEHLYMQKPCPADATGVEVTLDTVDPNGNWIHIGRVTTDMSGMFKKMFTPEVPGEYTIIATFEGSESYWASYAETAIGVSEAPAPVEEPEEAPAYTAIDLAIITAVVVVAIIVLYTLYTIRKQRK